MPFPGEMLGDRYRLDDRIAAGGMGQVWRATDTVLGRPVAVKTLLAGYAGDAGFRSRFQHEARAMASLRHGGIAPVYDFGETEEGAYLVMARVDGLPLNQWIAEQGPLTADETMSIVAHGARALAAAHAAGIVHRDVKPGNLIIEPDGNVVLVDFGVARSAHSVTLTGAKEVVGTALYIAPEQVSKQTIGPAADLYALGAVAYHCLAGRPPFLGDNPLAVAIQHLDQEPPPLPASVPEPVRELVATAMAKDPAQRFASAVAMAEAAEAVSASLRATSSGSAGNGPAFAAGRGGTDPAFGSGMADTRIDPGTADDQISPGTADDQAERDSAEAAREGSTPGGTRMPGVVGGAALAGAVGAAQGAASTPTGASAATPAGNVTGAASGPGANTPTGGSGRSQADAAHGADDHRDRTLKFAVGVAPAAGSEDGTAAGSGDSTAPIARAVSPSVTRTELAVDSSVTASRNDSHSRRRLAGLGALLAVLLGLGAAFVIFNPFGGPGAPAPAVSTPAGDAPKPLPSADDQAEETDDDAVTSEDDDDDERTQEPSRRPRTTEPTVEPTEDETTEPEDDPTTTPTGEPEDTTTPETPESPEGDQ